ncbi:uncharacterized protein M421DRAFT_190831 [Didymella exigua CBS 183.55]|uniref:Uncharacterized protein n=1 Tax=Didymella exigua CBS 183.55 TaxID=1150837 RepID=A0A6A5RXM8_9PLEO|nr:uncharacterized protein M421DRAFT_190831 [Didymella exigua CBS 183.55]KAF1933151.1 hypothetical protein M421DRAFT_190831 [Didymella exigua CBS 183.55]
MSPSHTLHICDPSLMCIDDRTRNSLTSQTAIQTGATQVDFHRCIPVECLIEGPSFFSRVFRSLHRCPINLQLTAGTPACFITKRASADSRCKRHDAADRGQRPSHARHITHARQFVAVLVIIWSIWTMDLGHGGCHLSKVLSRSLPMTTIRLPLRLARLQKSRAA